MLHILSDGFGALLVFALLGYYYRIQARASEENMRPVDLYSFVAAKKGIALILLVVFCIMGVNSAIGAEDGANILIFFTVSIQS